MININQPLKTTAMIANTPTHDDQLTNFVKAFISFFFKIM